MVLTTLAITVTGHFIFPAARLMGLLCFRGARVSGLVFYAIWALSFPFGKASGILPTALETVYDRTVAPERVT